jgi:hypothetical protein
VGHRTCLEVLEKLPVPGFEPRIVQPVGGHCTEYALRLHRIYALSQVHLRFFYGVVCLLVAGLRYDPLMQMCDGLCCRKWVHMWHFVLERLCLDQRERERE